MTTITRPDGLQYAVSEQPQPGVPTFSNAEIMLIHDQLPMPDEMAQALIRIKQVFPGAQVVDARLLGCPI